MSNGGIPLLVTPHEADQIRRMLRRQYRSSGGVRVLATPDSVSIGLSQVARRGGGGVATTALAAITELYSYPELDIGCKLVSMDDEGILTPYGEAFYIWFLMYDTDGLVWADIHPPLTVWNQTQQSGVVTLVKMPPLPGWMLSFPVVGTC